MQAHPAPTRRTFHRSVTVLSAAFGLVLLSAGRAEAQLPDPLGDAFHFEPFAGIYFPDDVDRAPGESGFALDDRRIMLGGRVSYAFPSHLFAEGGVAYSPVRFVRNGGLTNINTFIYSAVLGYDIRLAPRAHFFLLAGGSLTQWLPSGVTPSEEALGAVFGGGFRIYLSRALALRAEVRDHVVPNTLDELRARFNPGMQLESDLTNNVEATMSLSLSLPTRRDSDRDYVLNSYDACPGTPAGTRADAFGCELDSDEDGVPDGRDLCSRTAPGIAIGPDGCALDTDGDGVLDDADLCMGTAVGVPVDAGGCPLDSDGDAVHDGADRCPDTPGGARVDAEGCGLDSDGDLVLDGIDRCPGTPAGREVDAEGCTVVEAGIEAGRLALSSVTFETGKAVLTPGARRILDDVGRALVQRPEVAVEIQGHTDATGPDELNLRLSDARARAVYEYLIAAFPGLDPGRFFVRGYGESEPVASNETAAGRAMNRRVEFVVRDWEPVSMDGTRDGPRER